MKNPILVKNERLKVILPLVFLIDVILIVIAMFNKTEDKCELNKLSVVFSLLAGYSLSRFILSAWLSYKQLIGRPLTEKWKYICAKDLLSFFVIFGLLMLLNNHKNCNTQYRDILLPAVVFTFLNLANMNFSSKGFGLSQVEVDELCESHNLNIAYGAASAYFFNYLDNFIPKIFKERVCQFSTAQQVKVLDKLVILLPKSCKVISYIDITPQIERARELLPYTLDIAGVKSRVYNITVYLINPGQNEFWCPIEYAQPLKQLWDLKCSGEITEFQMQQQRDLFQQYLEDFLEDRPEAKEACLLLPYDDTSNHFNLAECLHEACLGFMEN